MALKAASTSSSPVEDDFTPSIEGVRVLLSSLRLPVDEPNQPSTPPRPLVLFGGPGAGKTFLLRRLASVLRGSLSQSSKIAVVAGYGTLAQSVGGCTLHSWAGMRPSTCHVVSEEVELVQNRSQVRIHGTFACSGMWHAVVVCHLLAAVALRRRPSADGRALELSLSLMRV